MHLPNHVLGHPCLYFPNFISQQVAAQVNPRANHFFLFANCHERCALSQLVDVMKQRKTFPTNVADGVKGISEGLPHDSYEHIGKSASPLPRSSSAAVPNVMLRRRGCAAGQWLLCPPVSGAKLQEDPVSRPPPLTPDFTPCPCASRPPLQLRPARPHRHRPPLREVLGVLAPLPRRVTDAAAAGMAASSA